MEQLTLKHGGSLRGHVDQHGVTSYRGVPYAEPPVGELRFRAPTAASPWSGVRDATKFGPICPQIYGRMDELFGESDQPQSENGMLTLNIWCPPGTTPDDRLPVMVWVHGGALVSGSSSSEPYQGDNFARDGVILVGINYRLHAFGFLNFTDLMPGFEGSVNLGLKDVILGLKWVQEHIESFGGDASNVTVFGESAGGALTSGLISERSAHGTYKRLILQSGTIAVLQEWERSVSITRDALEYWNVAVGDTDALQRLSTAEVLDFHVHYQPETDTGRFSWIPTRDPNGLDLTALEAVDQGRADGIEIVAGWTVDEYRLRWLDREPDGPAVPLARVDEAFRNRAFQCYETKMPKSSTIAVEEKISNDQHFLAPVLRIVNTHAARGGVARIYEFQWKSPAQGGKLGACHALELPFVFDKQLAPDFHGPAPLPPSLVDALHGGWISIAHGNPSISGQDWSQYSPQSRNMAAFDSRSSLTLGPDSDIAELWQSAPDSWIGIA